MPISVNILKSKTSFVYNENMSIFGAKYKNDDPKFLSLKDFYDSIGNLISKDQYISKKDYMPLVESKKADFNEISTLKNNDTLKFYCKVNKTDYEQILKFIYAYIHIDETINKHNELFLEKHLSSDKAYLDGILKDDDENIILDDDQRKVVLSDEDYTLIIAGAGAGKTTTLEAKAKYLVEKKHIDPKRILLISFTKKATRELQERFNKIGIPAVISTFHSIGNTIISSNNEKHKIVDQGFMFNTLRDYLEEKMEDESFIKKIMLFFASYLETPLDNEKSLELFKKHLENNDLTTLKDDLDRYKEKLVRKKITIKAEKVRSIQECQIANFLFINGIDYEYEPLYPYCIRGTSKPYTPDFKIIQGDHLAYLEHYGINEDGTNSRFTPEELEAYKKHITDKETLHSKHKTELLHTYSKYSDGESLISHLKKELTTHGFKCEQIDNKRIYNELAERAEERYFTKLIQLLCNFINRFKTNAYTIEKFSEFQMKANDNKDERTLLFLDIARQCYHQYEKALKEAKAIDFEDMINNAAEILDQKIERNEKIPFDYIFIDEYQDISYQRFNLAEKLSKCSNAKILAVGDDWQSIYRFSGSDIKLFTEFENIMGYAKVLYLTNTHRNSQELIDMAGDFVMKNDLQKRKSLKSPKHMEDPVILMSYDDSYHKNSGESDEKDGPYYRMGLAIQKSLDHIHNEFGDETDVLLLGRYNFDGKNLERLLDLFKYAENKRIISLKYPKMKIRFMTAHSSKGLGASNVILVNGKDDVLGFPSKIEDDPVMKLVLKEAKEIDYAEERRLFYVAMTRTKNRVYMIVPKNHPSRFITEIKDSYTNIILNGPALENVDYNDYRYKCPRCGYPLQRKRKYFNRSTKELDLFVCSNDPEVCGFVTNDIAGGNMCIEKCPQCLDGYLIVKKMKNSNKRMLGCSNFNDHGGCSYVIMGQNYSPSAEKTSQNKNNYKENGRKLPIDRCILAGYPVLDLLKIIKYVLTNVTENTKFKFNKISLMNFLLGTKNEKLGKFRLENQKGYGRFEEKDKFALSKAIDAMIDLGFLTVNKEEYNHLALNNIEINDEFARKLFELFLK